MKKILSLEYYRQSDTLQIAQNLLGKFLVTEFDSQLTGGMIVETEAYCAPEDRASHAFGNRRTKRNEAMFAAGGVCYVYLCYGIHHLFNVVVSELNVPHAILVRAIEPLIGVAEMLKRRAKHELDRTVAGGPGALSQALGIHVIHNGMSLVNHQIWIEDRGIVIPSEQIMTSSRIGVGYAGDDALLPWRFHIKDNPWISR